MESKVIQLYPYRQVDLSGFQKVFVPDQEKIEKETSRLLNKKSTWEAANTVEAGDIAVCRMQSEAEKYNRDSIKITIGLGLFDRELEQQILGLAPGEELTAERQGQKVSVRILEILRKETPPMEDGFVRELQIPGVDTEEDYIGWLVRQQKREALQENLYEIRTHILDTVLEKSEIQIAPREYEVYVEGHLARLRLIAAREGLKLEEMTPEEFEGRIPVKSYQELVEMLKRDALRDLPIALAGWEEAKRQAYMIGDTQYEDFVQKGAAELGVEEELYRQAYSREFANLLMASSFYYDAIEAYAEENLFLEG